MKEFNLSELLMIYRKSINEELAHDERLLAHLHTCINKIERWDKEFIRLIEEIEVEGLDETCKRLMFNRIKELAGKELTSSEPIQNKEEMVCSIEGCGRVDKTYTAYCSKHGRSLHRIRKLEEDEE